MTTFPFDRSDRVFQLWAYTVGMGRLLLRSTASDRFSTRIDVVFQNVQAVQLLALLQGVVIERSDSAETERITRETGLLPDEDHEFFSVYCSNFVGYVVAGVVVDVEDTGEYFEPSAVWPQGPPAV